ncbi:MAG: T9SS type A sorting domain-containing protein, partial [Bacteroidetes bacterium]
DDKTAPSITCPDPVTVSCLSEVPDVDTDAVTTSDNCGGAVTVTHVGDSPSGSCPIVITRTYQAADACGNSTTCAQLITVDDKIAPTITCPANTTVSCSDEVPAVDVSSVSASDNCGGSVDIEHLGDMISNEVCENRYLLKRMYEATDVCGNTAVCTQTISVNDKTPPSITCPPALTLSCSNEVPDPDINAVVTSDNCGGQVEVTYVGQSVNDYVCANQFKMVRMYRAFDDCGNSSFCFQNITVDDQTPPTGECPETIMVSCAGDIPCDDTDPKINMTLQIIKDAYTDNCGGEITVTFDSGGDLTPCTYSDEDGYLQSRTLYFTVTDECGNSTSCSVSYAVPCVCTYTQGFWGNPNGKADGLTTAQILDTLLQYGPVFVGDSTDCGFAVATPACVLGILPGGGPSTPLSPGYQLNCNKQIKNTLVGQLVALELNIRYNAHFRDLHLDSLVLSGDCVVSPALLDKLKLGDTSTVQDLIALANRYLASICNGEDFPKGFGGSLTSALTTLNEFWDECRTELPCATDEVELSAEPESRTATKDAGLGEVQLVPNPAVDRMQVRLEAAVAGSRMLRIFDTGGQLVESQRLDLEQGFNAITLDLTSYGPGIYWISLTDQQSVITKRFVVYRD